MKKHQLLSSLASGILLSLVMSGCANNASTPSPNIALYAQHGSVSFQDSSLRIDSIGQCNEKATIVFEAKNITMTNDVPTKVDFSKDKPTTLEFGYSHFEDGKYASVKICFEDKEKRIIKVIKEDKTLITEPNAYASFGINEGPYLPVKCTETVTSMNKTITCSQE